MKLSKKLVVTGLLFSSVLGSVNVGSITAMAATAPQTSGTGAQTPAPGAQTPAPGAQTPAQPQVDNKQSVKVDFVDKDNKLIYSKEITVGKVDKITKEDVPALSDKNYKVNDAQDYKIITDKNGIKKVTIKVSDNTTELNVTYTVDDKPATAEDMKSLVKKIKVSKDDKELTLEQVKSLIHSDNYVVAMPEENNKVTGIKIVDGNSVTINLRKKVTVTVQFKNKDDDKDIISNGKLVNKDYKEKLKSEEVVAPKGYEIVSGQSEDIVKNTAGEYTAMLKVLKLVKTIINYRTPSGKNFVVTDFTRPDEKIKLVAPAGYVIPDNIVKDFKANKNQPTINILVTPAKPAPTPAKKVTTQINFVEKSTNKSVYSYAVSGANGQEVNVKTPTGFTLVKGSDAKYKLDKSVSAITLYVTENPTIGTTSKISSTVTTKTNASLYDNKGKIVKNRGLGVKSSWFVDQKMVADGVTYYRVATNEWVKASDVEEYATVNATVTTKAGDAKLLYTTEGKAVKNRALSGNSSWFSDRSATINGEKMYRVATNEWVKASDIK